MSKSSRPKGKCSACDAEVTVTTRGNAYRHGTYTTCVGTGDPVVQPRRRRGSTDPTNAAVDFLSTSIDISGI